MSIGPSRTRTEPLHYRRGTGTMRPSIKHKNAGRFQKKRRVSRLVRSPYLARRQDQDAARYACSTPIGPAGNTKLQTSAQNRFFDRESVAVLRMISDHFMVGPKQR
jgi:hypothetical protein